MKEYWKYWLDTNHSNFTLPGKLRWFARINDRDEEVDITQPDTINGKIIRPRSRTFIPARVADNKFLNEDYVALLNSQPEPYRSQLLYGDFSIGMRDSEWQSRPVGRSRSNDRERILSPMAPA